MRKIIIPYLSLLLIGQKIFAQNLDKIPFAGVDYTNNRLKNDSLNARSKQINGFVNVPVLYSERRLIGIRLEYNSQYITNADGVENLNLQGFTSNLYWRRTYASGKQLHIFAQAGIFSDMEDVSGKDLRYLIGATYMTQINDALQTGLGLGYARQFFGHQILPFVSIVYKIDDRWELKGALPMRPQLNYKISEKWTSSIEINGTVESYRLSEKTYNDAYLQMTTWKGISKIKYLLAKKHQFYFGAGLLRQNINLYEDNGSSNWKLITFDLNKRDEPLNRIKVVGHMFNFGYSFLF